MTWGASASSCLVLIRNDQKINLQTQGVPTNAYIAYTVGQNKPMLDEALEADSVTVLLRLLNITPETYEECT